MCLNSRQFIKIKFPPISPYDFQEKEEEGWRKHFDPVKTTFWFIGVRQNGNFELYSVPDFTLR